MNRRKKRMLTILVLLVFCALVGIFYLYLALHRDTIPPEITFDEEVIFLSEKQAEDIVNREDDKILFTGVHANDDVDGDITDKVFIYDIDVMYDGLYAIATYRVMDKSNNMANGKRLLYLKTPQEIHEIVMKQLFGIDINKKKQVTSEPPVIKLDSNVTIKAGETFDITKYVQEFSDDKDTPEELAKNTTMEGVLDVDKAGVYILAFYAKDSDGNLSEPAIMRVVVE